MADIGRKFTKKDHSLNGLFYIGSPALDMLRGSIMVTALSPYAIMMSIILVSYFKQGRTYADAPQAGGLGGSFPPHPLSYAL